jgi:hypothetical integral membrane protein (TIGR02206 family)
MQKTTDTVLSSDSYFWKQYQDLPDGLGYGRFSAEHLCTLLILVVIIVLVTLWFRGRGDRTQRKVLLIIPVAMVFLECFKDGFLMTQGRFGVHYLPLHLCSLGVFVFLAAAFCRSERMKGVFGEIALTLILPGTVAALIFPDWTELYPVFNFMNLYGYLWHGLLVLCPILMLNAGFVHLSIKHIHYDFIFLLCTGIPIWFFDKAFDVNYMFVNRAPKGTPLQLVEAVSGEQWYLAGYAVFAALVILIIYLCISIFRKVRGKS